MILSIKAEPNEIKKPTVYSVDTGDGNKFPVLTIDKDSYIAGATIESGINFHWDKDTLLKNKDKMLGEVKDFADFFYKDDSEKKPFSINRLTEGQAFVYYLDMDEPYCIWKKVIKQFAEAFNGTQNELILYLSPDEKNFSDKAECILQELSLYESYDCYVNICTDVMEDDADLLQCADYYISNRHVKNVHRMCKAELYDVQCLIGVSYDIFWSVK